MEEKWLGLGEACRTARRTQNQLYRLAAIGVVRTKSGPQGRVEFLLADLHRLRANCNVRSLQLNSANRPGS